MRVPHEKVADWVSNETNFQRLVKFAFVFLWKQEKEICRRALAKADLIS